MCGLGSTYSSISWRCFQVSVCVASSLLEGCSSSLYFSLTSLSPSASVLSLMRPLVCRSVGISVEPKGHSSSHTSATSSFTIPLVPAGLMKYILSWCGLFIVAVRCQTPPTIPPSLVVIPCCTCRQGFTQRRH